MAALARCAGFWHSYAERRGEMIGIFQAAMIEGRFRDRWLEPRGEAITRIATDGDLNRTARALAE